MKKLFLAYLKKINHNSIFGQETSLNAFEKWPFCIFVSALFLCIPHLKTDELFVAKQVAYPPFKI